MIWIFIIIIIIDLNTNNNIYVIVQNRWSPSYDVAAILTSIQSLLHDPNPSSPANVEAARLFRENRKEYERRVKETGKFYFINYIYIL